MDALDVTMQATVLTEAVVVDIFIAVVIFMFVYRFLERKEMSVWKKIWTFLLFGVGGAVVSFYIISIIIATIYVGLR